MKLFIVSIRDSAADVFNRPYFAPAIGAATRQFMDEVNRVSDDNMLNKHPEDFALFLLGTFDDSNGSFDLGESPRQLALGKECVIKR